MELVEIWGSRGALTGSMVTTVVKLNFATQCMSTSHIQVDFHTYEVKPDKQQQSIIVDDTSVSDSVAATFTVRSSCVACRLLFAIIRNLNINKCS